MNTASTERGSNNSILQHEVYAPKVLLRFHIKSSDCVLDLVSVVQRWPECGDGEESEMAK